MSEHTKGPWKQRGEDSVCVIDANDNAIAFTDTFLPKKECIANAKLIAAAPELLEALKKIAGWATDNNPPDEAKDCETFRNALAAIAKAEATYGR